MKAGLGITVVVKSIACTIPERILLKPLNPQPANVNILADIVDRNRQHKVLQVFIEELKRAVTLVKSQ